MISLDFLTKKMIGVILICNYIDEVVGWKMVRSEALMAPDTELVLAALLGTGVQFLFLTVIEISLGVLGLYYGHKGTIKTTGIITYAFTGCCYSYLWYSLQWILLREIL